MVSLREISLLRLAAQGVVGPRPGTAADVVRWLTAVQAQDLPGALASVDLRTTVREPGGDVLAALGTGAVVRSWPMRGTLHLVPGEDLAWMLGLTSERVLAAAARRREQLGVDPAMIDRAASVAAEALTGRRSISRSDLLERWRQAGLLEVPQRGYHLLAHLAQRGLLCFGPVVDGEQHVVLLAEWVPTPRGLTGEAALAEWALRYFRSHGPATAQDFGWWTKLTAAQVRTGVGASRGRLSAVVVDDVEYLMDPRTPEILAEHRAEAEAVHLLPGFDEMILGYRRREASVPAAYAERILPGGNGMFRATVFAGGQVIGTWRRSGARRSIQAEPFTAFTEDVARAVAERARTFPAVPVRR